MRMRRLMIPALFLAVLPACLEDTATGPQLIACDPFLTSFSPLEGADTVAIANGISYIEVQEGTGALAGTGSEVLLSYTLYADGNPPALESSCGALMVGMTVGANNNLLPSFEAGIPGMREGGVRRLIIPADQAYTNEQHTLYGIDLVFDLHAAQVRN